MRASDENMKESSANSVLNQYLREKKHYCYYELKVASGKRFQFSKIEDVQDEGLPALEREGLVWKLSDEDMRRKPCDGFCSPPLPSYLVIRFGDRFCFVLYGKIAELRASGVKGISEEEAEKLSTKIVHIGA